MSRRFCVRPTWRRLFRERRQARGTAGQYRRTNAPQPPLCNSGFFFFPIQGARTRLGAPSPCPAHPKKRPWPRARWRASNLRPPDRARQGPAKGWAVDDTPVHRPTRHSPPFLSFLRTTRRFLFMCLCACIFSVSLSTSMAAATTTTTAMTTVSPRTACTGCSTMARRGKATALGRPAPTDRRSVPGSSCATGTTLYALTREAARWRQMVLVARTPRLLAEAREAREATMPTWDRGDDVGDTGKVDPVRLVVSMAFGFAHLRPEDD